MWAYACACVTVWLLLSRSAWFRDRAGAAGFFAVEGGGILWQPQGTGLVLGRVGSRLARPLEWWFRVGCWVCCAVAVACVAATVWGAAQGTAQLLHRFGVAPGDVAAAAATATAPAGDEAGTPVLQPLLPGVTVPGSEVPYLVVSVLLCLVWHELGHGLCAVSLKLHVQSGGVALAWFVMPTAFVTIEDHLRRIAPVKQLRIYTAGAWHNLTHGLLCACFVLFLPTLLSPLYATCSDDASCLWIAEDRAKLFGATLCGEEGGGVVDTRLPSTPAPVALLTLNGRTKDGWEEVLQEADSGRQRLSLSWQDYEMLRSEVVDGGSSGGSSSSSSGGGGSGSGGLLQFEVESLANVSAAAALHGTASTATPSSTSTFSSSPSTTPLSARPRTRMIVNLSGRRVIEKASSFNVSSSSNSSSSRSSGSVVLRFVPPASGEGLFAFELMRGVPGGGDGGGGVRVKAGVLASSAAVRGLALRRFAPRYSVGGAAGSAALLPVFPTLLEACGVTDEDEDGDGVRPSWWRIAMQAAYANAPLHIGALLMYMQMISFGLVLVNLLPCTTLDGDHALLCLLRMAHSRGWVGRGFDDADDGCDAEAGVCLEERGADVAIDIPSSPVIELYEGGDHNPPDSLLRLHTRIVAACTALLGYTVLVSVVLAVGR